MNGELKNQAVALEGGEFVTSDSTVVAKRDLLACTVQNELVILSTTTGTYYGLDAVGKRIWELIQNPMTFEELLRCILDEYEVEPKRCRQDLEKLLGDLATNNLVEITG